ncbi:MAG TPA: transcriptional regulator [Gammaproteobacteria bacterium]|nr:transcriptional regulator [Gammaproteobacteria bacterium]
MKQSKLSPLLDDLLRLPHETEWVEFKEARNQYDFNKLGRYFSSLANEVNLKNRPCGWLVFGVVDKDHTVCGSHFRENPADLNSLKQEVAAQTMGGITFIEIYVVNHPAGRVVMFQVPPAPKGMPVAWKGHWYGRDGESIGPLNLQELEIIRAQNTSEDWSAVICAQATLDDLDPQAIAMARANFEAKNKDRSFTADIKSWSLGTFLDRAKITRDGKITRAALLLLGRSEAVHHIQPAVAQITWQLKAEEDAYEHFGPPFLLTTSEVYLRIRNTMQKIDLQHQLVPLEMRKYEKGVILEALHNAIAHQDYCLQSRIVVTETTDQLYFVSAGGFFEGKLADYILGDRTPQRYRNRFLADAMVNVNMIDTMGYGIRRMFDEQRKRFYPLPDIDVSVADSVTVKIYGKVIDPHYTAVLMAHKELPLETVILLDKIQKRQTIEKAEANYLRRQQLIEGRYPRLFVAAHIAAATDDKAKYIKNRAFDDAHYKKMVIEYLKKYGKASRQDIDELLTDKLSDVLSEPQKSNKVRNLLYAMSKRDRTIRNSGPGRSSQWELVLDDKTQD